MKKIQISDYNYDLPDHRIARFPLKNRDQSKLLVYQEGKPIKTDIFENISEYIYPDQLLAINNSKVIHARLHFQKPTGSQIEIFCLKPYKPSEYQSAFRKKRKCIWICLIGNLKKWKEDLIYKQFECKGKKITLSAKQTGTIANEHLIEFEWNEDITFSELISCIGIIPVPPYLKRDSQEIDKERYQTIYSKQEGSVAAPTAGLHITESVLQKIKQKNIGIIEFTLHVSAGTFQPVKSEYVDKHRMHAETFILNKQTLETLYNSNKPVIPLGTTTLRALESIYWLGVNIYKRNNLTVKQWDPYVQEKDIEPKQSLENILNYFTRNNIEKTVASTELMIIPGYKFQMVSGLITNFHQPGSTLLLLVAAFTGKNWKEIYNYALQNNFRFLSYGDSSIILPKK